MPLADPRLRDEELAEVIETYRSGWLTMGPRTAELERAFRDYTGAREAIAVSSCTAALHLSFLAAGLGPGDSVVVPSLTFAATVNMFAHAGAEPEFSDIKSLSEPWLSADAVEQKVGPNTRAIVTMAYGGHLGETEALADLAERRGVMLIEDAAHASGSWSGGRHAGTFGLAGALSFSASKNLGIGEGGMLLTDDEVLAERARHLRWHGISASTLDRHLDEAPEYELGELGFNYRIDDPRAALARARLRRLDENNRRRAAVDAAYREAFAAEERLAVTAAPPAGERTSHCLFTVVLDELIDRAAFRTSLARSGVQTSIHFPPVHWSGFHARPDHSLPVTEAYARRSVTLPIFPDMEGWQQEVVIESVTRALRHAEHRAVA